MRRETCAINRTTWPHNQPLYADETPNGLAMMLLTISTARPIVRVAFRG